MKHQTGHSNKAADVLSHCPFNPSCDSENDTDCNEVDEDKNEIVSTLNAVSIFEQVMLEEMTEEQQKHPVLELVYQQVTAGEKPKTSAITKIKSKAVQKYLPQFNRLAIKKVSYTDFTLIMM